MVLPRWPLQVSDALWKDYITGTPPAGSSSSFSVMSWHTLSQSSAHNAASIPDKILNWESRKHRLLAEVKGCCPDILCLQDVDNYEEFWQPALSSNGWDSIFVQRTSAIRPRAEGVVIAWARDYFQLIRSKSVEFNDNVENLYQDDPVRDPLTCPDSPMRRRRAHRERVWWLGACSPLEHG